MKFNIKTDLNWKWLFIEITVFTFLCAGLVAVIPDAFAPSVFFLFGYVTRVWDVDYTRIYNKEE